MSDDLTYLAFQHDGTLHSLEAVVKDCLAFTDLSEADRILFKTPTNSTHVLVTDRTIFHPQGGGQPSDTGVMKAEGCNFTVEMVRTSATQSAQVLHFGTYTTSTQFKPGDTVIQAIDSDKRHLFSRYHTAGHVLGAAVRFHLEKELPDFDELKASHFPNEASCEFQGRIDGKWKETIQKKVDEFIDKDLPVEIHFWDVDDFRDNGLERLIPENWDAMAGGKGRKLRVVRIVGADTYPCGGTHVPSTKGCGKTTVRKISRMKNTSKVSYAV